MSKKIDREVVDDAARAEFYLAYVRYAKACVHQRKFGGNSPDRSEIDFYLGQKPGIPGIDQIAHEVEAEFFGKDASSIKAA